MVTKLKAIELFSTGGFILVSDYVRMEVTLVGASWDVVAESSSVPSSRGLLVRSATPERRSVASEGAPQQVMMMANKGPGANIPP
eukprot:scaffold106456_cov61-Phaeocystis_antarctica.AAC.2